VDLSICCKLERTATEAESPQIHLENVEYTFKTFYFERTQIQEGPEWEEVLSSSSLPSSTAMLQ
jgi:hypothetical protein